MWAPHGQDATVVGHALAKEGFDVHPCVDGEEVLRRPDGRIAAAVVAEEALTAAARQHLRTRLDAAPTWSDLSLIVLLGRRARHGSDVWATVRGLEARATISLLERPLRVATLASAVDAALQARRRQLQVRDELESRRAAEEALRESERRLELAERAGRVGVFDWQIGSGHVHRTAVLDEILGLPPSSAPSWDGWARRVLPEDVARLRPLMEEWVRTGRPEEQKWEYRFRRPDRTVGWMAAAATLVRDRDGVPTRVIGTNLEVTDVRRAEERLHELNATLEQLVRERTAVAERRARALRRLAGRLELAEHQERQRLDGILHDELQQLLFAAKVGLPSQRERRASPWRQALDRVEELLSRGLSVSRHLGQELSPRVLEVGTLSEVFAWLGEWFREHHGLSVTVEMEGTIPPVPKPVRVFLYGAVRELLLNVVKHAGVHEARICASWRRPLLSVEVADGGRGFDPAVIDLDRHGSFGLFHIQERLQALEGRLEIDARPGGGAVFRVVVPLRPGSTVREKATTRRRPAG